MLIRARLQCKPPFLPSPHKTGAKWLCRSYPIILTDPSVCVRGSLTRSGNGWPKRTSHYRTCTTGNGSDVPERCQRCRFRKSRCIVTTRGRIPSACRRCLSAGVACVFDDATPPARRTTRDASQSGPDPALNVARSREEDDSGVLSPQFSYDTSPDAAGSPHSGRLVVRNPHQTREAFHFTSFP